MNRCIKSIPLAALLGLAAASAWAQAPAPAAGASAPSTLGVTPAEAARANQQAEPRSDTATVVRTAPSAATQASGAVSGAANSAATTTGANTTGSAMGRQNAAGAGNVRSARADRN